MTILAHNMEEEVRQAGRRGWQPGAESSRQRPGIALAVVLGLLAVLTLIFLLV